MNSKHRTRTRGERYEQKKILIVEDDISIAEIERDFLDINGFDSFIVTNGIDGLREALSGEYALILLDLMLPGLDGYEITRRIRDSVDIPILMVTAKTEEFDKIRGLGLGADDYISKPFSPTELVARVKANIAQYERLTGEQPTKSGEITAGNVKINLKARRVYVNENEIELKNKEYELLLFFVSNPDTVFSKETLYERIWGADALGDIVTVAVHINRLREKIERHPANPIHIQTVWGAGYRFKPSL
ncbi:MAG: response regulator transcription factor [Synergistaceae bacterium]|jgi:DNA-binding response OmpR family regulator|nr:response regulator transcription factor [Synergistaceae bacterium]